MNTKSDFDILLAKSEAYRHDLEKQPKTLYISENKAFELFRQTNISFWRSEGLIQACQRENGRLEYELKELNQIAAEKQVPFWRKRPRKKYIL